MDEEKLQKLGKAANATTKIGVGLMACGCFIPLALFLVAIIIGAIIKVFGG